MSVLRIGRHFQQLAKSPVVRRIDFSEKSLRVWQHLHLFRGFGCNGIGAANPLAQGSEYFRQKIEKILFVRKGRKEDDGHDEYDSEGWPIRVSTPPWNDPCF